MKIGTIVFDKNLLKEINDGDELEIIHQPDVTDKKRIGVKINGIASWAITKESLVNQLSDSAVMQANDVFDALDFKHNNIKGRVCGQEEITNAVGNTNTILILEVVEEPKATVNQTVSNPVDSNIETLKSRGSVQEYKALGEIALMNKEKKPIDDEFYVAKEKSKLVLYYKGNGVGELFDLPATIKSKIEKLEDGEQIKVNFKEYKMGSIYVTADLSSFEVNTEGKFDDVVDHALKCGVTEEELKVYISLMVDTYGIPIKVAKMIISSWEPISPKYRDRYVTLDRIAGRDKKGNIHPLYIDHFNYVKNFAINLLSGRKNLCLLGEASVGKNTLIETLAGLFRAPLLRQSLNEGTDLSALLGDRCVNEDNTIGFAPSELIQGAEADVRVFVVMDEINRAQTGLLSSLHSILEPDNRSIVVPNYKYVKANKGFRILATMNPSDSEDYTSTRGMDAATASRFEINEIKSDVKFEDVLKNAYPEADKKEISVVAGLYNKIKKMHDSRQVELSSAFLAIRRYFSIFEDELANEYIPLKDRCISALVKANPDDRTQSDVIMQTINDSITN